jgi:hypothetical protein
VRGDDQLVGLRVFGELVEVRLEQDMMDLFETADWSRAPVSGPV